MKVKYVIDLGHPYGEQVETRKYEENKLTSKELNEELTNFVMSNIVAHYEVLDEKNQHLGKEKL